MSTKEFLSKDCKFKLSGYIPTNMISKQEIKKAKMDILENQEKLSRIIWGNRNG